MGFIGGGGCLWHLDPNQAEELGNFFFEHPPLLSTLLVLEDGPTHFRKGAGVLSC